MLKDGLLARTFIRTSILGLRAIAPLSITYCVGRGVGWIQLDHSVIRTIIDVYAVSESVFFLFVYLPRKWLLNQPSSIGSTLTTRDERQSLFRKTFDACSDPHDYLSGWFKGAKVQDLHREDVKDFIYWRLWSTPEKSLDTEQAAEVEGYVQQTEEILQVDFPSGRSKNTASAVTFEPLAMVHRPLLWYLLFVGGTDSQMITLMRWYGFSHYTPGAQHSLLTLPPRPLTLLRWKRSSSAHFSYWYTPHTSKNHLPILFIHGIGVGLHFYLSFFSEYMSTLHAQGIGLIAIELLPVSSRIAQAIPSPLTTTMAISKILHNHNWSRVVLASHSYGSVIATWLLRNPETAPMIGPLLFIDPVAFSFHAPAVPWNFLRRKPTTASEWQLWYFASSDPDVSVTLTRRFDWVANSLWREDVVGRKRSQDEGEETEWGTTVVLSGRDIITDVDNLGGYLSQHGSRGTESDAEGVAPSWKDRTWKGEGLDIIWRPELNHAEMFESPEDRQLVLRVLEAYARPQA